jgi:hypothetical protein
MTDNFDTARHLVVRDDDRRVHTHALDAAAVFALDEMFAVVLQAHGRTAGAWMGWLATTNRQGMRFSAADLDDPRFLRWLADLPGWDGERMSAALRSSGLRLVWRRPG